MGIQGLLPMLKSIISPVGIEDLRGCSVAVDTYSWLHKGALSCSRDLCKSLPTSRHIDYCMHRVNLLRHYGVKPILVFDGGLLPMKCEQETKRLRARKENLERAVEHESAGNSAAAYECYQKAVDITPSIALELIMVLRKEHVDYIVAPYEADAQMAFLSINNYVDAVITEDSDLIPFGCPRIIFKMDKFGQGVQYRYSMLQKNKELDFTGFSKQMLLEMCILSGCDYLQSLPGMGLKKAHALMRKLKSYDKVIKHLRYSAISVPPSYEDTFKKAIWSFQHQRVYDPINEDIVHLTDIPNDQGSTLDLDFLGPLLPQNVVKGIARGNLDPFTKLPFQKEMIHSNLVLDRTYALKEIKVENCRRKLNLSVKENVLTNYFCATSVEAKKQFKIPRVSPKSSSPMVKCCSPDENISSPSLDAEVAACHTSVQGCLLESSNAHEVRLSKEPREEPSPADHELHLKFAHREKSSGSDHPLSLPVSKQKFSKTSSLSDKNPKCESLLNLGELRPIKRKAIVRSRYFQHKVSDDNGRDNKQENTVLKDKSDGIWEMARDASLEDNRCQSSTDRIKSTCKQTMWSENAEDKCTLSNGHPSEKGRDNLDTSTEDTEAQLDQGNFVSNISHLSHYSEVAEKSMERFMSIMSSFKCTQSGSRASGLRAPLKDASNTCTLRSTVEPMDFSKFSYAPNKRKFASIPR